MKLTVEELLEKDLSWFDSCSIEELESYIETLESAAASDHITQMTLKIQLNSLYGALANKHFTLANPDMAAAITSSGRFFIQLLANNVERELQALMPSDIPYIKSGGYGFDLLQHRKHGRSKIRRKRLRVDSGNYRLGGFL